MKKEKVTLKNIEKNPMNKLLNKVPVPKPEPEPSVNKKKSAKN